MSGQTRIINATAPIRVCDLGGWTDTWFAEQGAVLNVGVYPYAEVQIKVRQTDTRQERQISLYVENFGDRYTLNPALTPYDKHPLLEASIDIMDIPQDLSLEINLYSQAPAGCSTGTSASVSVALIAALDMLNGGRLTNHEIARLAHRVETEKLGLQCGIQDQLCAAYGGICFIEMFNYPYASVSQISVGNRVWWELERRLVLIYLGKTHSSSEVHGQVIARLDAKDADKSALEPMRRAAYAGKAAIAQGDFEGFGRAMVANTEAQQALHPALVSDAAKTVIELAKQHGCLGWKVNGAGGEGGSLTVLCGAEDPQKRQFIEAVHTADPTFRVIPTYLARIGIRRWECSC